MLGCKPTDTPMKATYKLGPKQESPPVDIERYQRLIGKLIYLSYSARH